MQDFIDLQGASDASYRFRRLPEGETHLRIAGNYAFARSVRGSLEVVGVGMTTDLSQARAAAPAIEGARLHLFTRLNVARQAREAEHADLVSRYPELAGGA